MKTLDFVKEDTGRWYVVLPEWTGPKEALEMVLGADTLLDVASNNESNVVTLNISEKKFKGSDELVLTKIDNVEGAFYRLTEFEGKNIGLNMWLCDVCKWIFGEFPGNIYIKRIPFSSQEKRGYRQEAKEVILLQEQSLKRYEEELRQNPNSLFWRGAAKNTKEFIEELNKTHKIS